MARLQQYPLRFEPTERASWQAAADQADLPLAAWIREACNRAAQAASACQHKNRRTGQSGLRVCADCGKMNP